MVRGALTTHRRPSTGTHGGGPLPAGRTGMRKGFLALHPA